MVRKEGLNKILMRKEAKILKSPINYTGNKYRIFNQISNYFPNEINCMVDLFCGGATVGINTNAKKIIFIDSNEMVLGLLDFLSRIDFSDFLCECEKIITKYGLSYSYKYGYDYYRKKCFDQNDNNGLKDYNKKGFYSLREDYNCLQDKKNNNAFIMLYLLMVYGFNNDIRFNANGEYNLPIGKTDLNRNNINKVREYIEWAKNRDLMFICSDFSSEDTKNIINHADFVYMDPPYLIGNAVYNSSWNLEKEYELLGFIDELMKQKINFALSNVVEKVGAINLPLKDWCKRNADSIEMVNIKYNYKSSSYNKKIRDAKEKEILVFNKDYK